MSTLEDALKALLNTAVTVYTSVPNRTTRRGNLTAVGADHIVITDDLPKNHIIPFTAIQVIEPQ
jgi:hypothetical protein